MRAVGLAFALALCAALAPARAAAAPQTGRAWVYLAGNLQLSPSWSLSLVPGFRYELARTDAPAKGHYLDEVFLGPNWSRRFGDFGLKLSLWYYFLGFPRPSGYPVAHNLELVPTFDYRIGPLELSYRIIFHNTIYASVYPVGQRWGFGTVMRNLVQARLKVGEGVALILGDEPWFALVENAGTDYHSAGWWQRGFRLNRLYAGADFKLASGLSISPQYVFEAAIGADGGATELGHYGFVTLAYTLKAF